ncbi:MAG: hypothetical protein HRT57_05010 [Crocinitomicaceae bacterium]|nr:hypothetical protein [Crocinitomicaceae bacterium]
MKRRTTFLIIAMAVLFLPSCKREESVNIDQNRIYSSYDYTYDANANKSSMTATFRLDNSGGQKIELSYPSRVSYNGEGLAWKNAMGYYSLNRSGNLNGGSFSFIDTESNEFQNQVSNLNSVEIPFGMNSISKSGNFFLPWNGVPLVSGETIKVTISGGDQTLSKTFTVTAEGTSHVILDQYKLAGLAVGTANIQIEREMSSYLEQSGLAGGRISAQYKSRKIAINIMN